MELKFGVKIVITPVRDLSEGLNGVDWQLTNTRNFNRQLTFEVRFTDNWQKAFAIVIRLNFTENNFFGWNIITFIFKFNIHVF